MPLVQSVSRTDICICCNFGIAIPPSLTEFKTQWAYKSKEMFAAMWQDGNLESDIRGLASRWNLIFNAKYILEILA